MLNPVEWNDNIIIFNENEINKIKILYHFTPQESSFEKICFIW